MKALRNTRRPEDVNAALARPKGPGFGLSRSITGIFNLRRRWSMRPRVMSLTSKAGGKMLVTLAGAMSTAELGISLAAMIRQDKIHAITVCTGANLEEDIFNLVAHGYYERVPHYRPLTAADEQDLLDRHMTRVTDTCIGAMEAMRRIEKAILSEWVQADQAGESYFPHEFLYKVLRGAKLKRHYQVDPKNSWMIAACEKNLPIIVPGWEDSTLGNMFAAHVISGAIKRVHTVRTGIEYMASLAGWYTKTAKTSAEPRRARSVSSRLAAASRAISRSASCRCCTVTSAAPACRSGVISARSAIPPRAMAATPARCRTKRSPGASSGRRRRSSSSRATPQSWRR